MIKLLLLDKLYSGKNFDEEEISLFIQAKYISNISKISKNLKNLKNLKKSSAFKRFFTFSTLIFMTILVKIVNLLYTQNGLVKYDKYVQDNDNDSLMSLCLHTFQPFCSCSCPDFWTESDSASSVTVTNFIWLTNFSLRLQSLCCRHCWQQ